MLNFIINKFRQLKTDIVSYALSNEFAEQFTVLKKSELSEGKKGSGESLKPKYMRSYHEFKKTLPSYKLDGTPDLLVTGAFYSSLETTADTQIIGLYKTGAFSNREIYFGDLEKRYDNDGTMYDLTPENLEKVADNLQNKVLTLVNDNLK